MNHFWAVICLSQSEAGWLEAGRKEGNSMHVFNGPVLVRESQGKRRVGNVKYRPLINYRDLSDLEMSQETIL